MLVLQNKVLIEICNNNQVLVYVVHTQCTRLVCEQCNGLNRTAEGTSFYRGQCSGNVTKKKVLTKELSKILVSTDINEALKSILYGCNGL